MCAEHICKEIGIDINVVWNIYPYGSKVYGTANEKSDSDFIIVHKTSMLPSGAFKDNALSNEDRTIQGVQYGRGGFMDAINTYMLPAIEAISLDDKLIVQKKFNFKMHKYNEKEMVKSIIKQSSNSWYLADLGWQREHNTSSGTSHRIKKGIWHALRILNFGGQLKESQKITDFTETNELLNTILNDSDFKPSNYIGLRDFITSNLKNVNS